VRKYFVLMSSLLLNYLCLFTSTSATKNNT